MDHETFEKKLMEKWDKDKVLRDEFFGNFALYLLIQTKAASLQFGDIDDEAGKDVEQFKQKITIELNRAWRDPKIKTEFSDDFSVYCHWAFSRLDLKMDSQGKSELIKEIIEGVTHEN